MGGLHAYGNKQYSKSGSFMVRPVEAETQILLPIMLFKKYGTKFAGIFI
jgi:hypothetical protein